MFSHRTYYYLLFKKIIFTPFFKSHFSLILFYLLIFTKLLLLFFIVSCIDFVKCVNFAFSVFFLFLFGYLCVLNYGCQIDHRILSYFHYSRYPGISYWFNQNFGDIFSDFIRTSFPFQHFFLRLVLKSNLILQASILKSLSILTLFTTVT